MRLVLLVLLLAPVPAFAMAEAIGLIAFELGMSTAAFVQAVIVVGSLIYGAAQQRRMERQNAARERNAKRDANNAMRDRTITAVATNAPFRYVLGRARVGSDIVVIFKSGDRDQFQHLVCVHAAHECDGFEEFYIAGKEIGALDADGYVTGGDYYASHTEFFGQSTFTNSLTLTHTPISTVSAVRNRDRRVDEGDGQAVVPYTMAGNVLTFDNPEGFQIFVTYQYTVETPRVRVIKHLGTPTDTADAYLMSVVPTKWLSTAVLRNSTYSVVTLDLDLPEFQGGIPAIEPVLRGAKLYDFRTGVTAWSQNNILALYYYLTSDVCGVNAADLPMAQYIAAANVCDEAQSFGPLYTFNGAITSDEDQKQVLEKIAQSMAGGIVATSWDVWAGKYVAPVMALLQEDIVGAWSVTPGISGADIYNGVRGQFITAENEYVLTDFQPYQNATYLAADGREYWSNIDFPYTDTTRRVHNLSRIFTEDQRNGFILKAEFSLKAWTLRPGQRVTFTSAFLGQSAKVYRVTDKTYSPSSMVELTLKEDVAEIWDLADAVTVDATPNTDLPNPFAIDPLALLTCTSGTDDLLIAQDGTIISRIHVTWPISTSQGVVSNGVIEIEWRKVDSTAWQKTTASGSDTEAYLSPVKDGAFYTVRARAVSPSFSNAQSNWTYATPHQVIGKTAPPPNITDLSIAGAILNWTPISKTTTPDLAGYVFRFHYGNNVDWGSAVALHEGIIVSSPFEPSTRPSGPVTIMGKAIDTSGNESLATGNVITDLGDAPIANVVETITFDPTFPGTYSGCSVVGVELVATALDSFYGTPTQSFYDLSTLPFYEAGSFGQMVYTTGEIVIGSALAGSIMTLLSTSQGADLFIEYRRSAPGSWYGADSDSFYGPDADSFYDAAGPWIPWPGQIAVDNDVYEFRFTIGAGAVQGKLITASLVIDAPDIVEYVNDLVLSAAGTAIPYTSNFTVITNIQATLQANASSAVTVEIDKTNPLVPVGKAYNAAHAAVGGASIDAQIKGY